MVRHLAVELDANNEQQDKLRGIMRGMPKDVIPAREKAQAARRQARELLTQTTIDRGAMEKLRAEQIRLRRQRVETHRAGAGRSPPEILSPEQRRKLSDRFPPFSAGGSWLAPRLA